MWLSIATSWWVQQKFYTLIESIPLTTTHNLAFYHGLKCPHCTASKTFQHVIYPNLFNLKKYTILSAVKLITKPVFWNTRWTMFGFTILSVRLSMAKLINLGLQYSKSQPGMRWAGKKLHSSTSKLDPPRAAAAKKWVHVKCPRPIAFWKQTFNTLQHQLYEQPVAHRAKGGTCM